MRQAGQTQRTRLGLLNSTDRDQFSNKELVNQINSDRKRIFDLKKELNSSVSFASDEEKSIVAQELKRLEFEVQDREAQIKHGSQPFRLPQ